MKLQLIQLIGILIASCSSFVVSLDGGDEHDVDVVVSDPIEQDSWVIEASEMTQASDIKRLDEEDNEVVAESTSSSSSKKLIVFLLIGVAGGMVAALWVLHGSHGVSHRLGNPSAADQDESLFRSTARKLFLSPDHSQEKKE